MGTRELLKYLEKLEIGLSSFSYEELGIVEAGELKKSFEIFRNGLEEKVFGADELSQLENIYDQMGISAPSKRHFNPLEEIAQNEPSAELFFSLVQQLEKTNLDFKQGKIVFAVKSMAKKLLLENNTTQRIHKLCPKENIIKESRFAYPQIDLKPVLEECMGDMELLEEAIKCYKLHIFEFVGSLKVQMDRENYDEIPVSCQKLLPSLRMIRTSELTHIVSQIETTCKTDRDFKYLEFLYHQFLAEFSTVDKIVDAELKVLKNM